MRWLITWAIVKQDIVEVAGNAVSEKHPVEWLLEMEKARAARQERSRRLGARGRDYRYVLTFAMKLDGEPGYDNEMIDELAALVES